MVCFVWCLYGFDDLLDILVTFYACGMFRYVVVWILFICVVILLFAFVIRAFVCLFLLCTLRFCLLVFIVWCYSFGVLVLLLVGVWDYVRFADD